MAAHAAITFMTRRISRISDDETIRDKTEMRGYFNPTEILWMKTEDSEIDGQTAFAKIVLQVDSEEELYAIAQEAHDAGLEVNSVKDSGLNINETGTFVGIAIGPDEAENIDPITRRLHTYR